MELNIVWLLLLAAAVTEATWNTEYFVGFFKNYNETSTITLFITTTESVPVPFTVSSSTGQIYSGNATNSLASNVTLPSSFIVLDNTIRDKGVLVHATDASKELTVHGVNYRPRSADGFVVLPCFDFQEQNYTYYAVSTYFFRSSSRLISQVLLIGCENNTEISITPTQTIEIPSDLARGSNSPVTLTSGRSYTITVSRFQTFMFFSTLDLTGSKVVSNIPIAFFSGHECADVPAGVEACDHLVEQLPPTLTWGRRLFVASSLGKTAGEMYKLITSTAKTAIVCYCYLSGGNVSETFTASLNGAGRSHEFNIAQNMFCSIQASSPILLVQFAIGAAREPAYYGDPFMMMIPPVEQYRNNYTFVTQSGFQNAITVTVALEFFNSEDIVLNGNSLSSANWTEIYCSTQTVCGYGTRIYLSVGRNFLYHRHPMGRLGTFVYGFAHRVGYGYPAGTQLVPITAECVPPVAPRNGSLENYTNTTEGSVVFYRCYPGHVPKGRMKAVCTENGWSPNPADLSCTAAPSEATSSIDIGAVIGGTIAGVMVLVTPLFGFLLYNKRRKRRKHPALCTSAPNRSSTHTYVGEVKVEMQQFDKHRAKEELNEEAARYLQDFPEEKVFHTSNLHLLDSVGQGEFGIVYKAHLTRPALRKAECETVAVKTIKGFLDPSDVTDFLKECLKMKAFVHPHVMGILGICLAGQVPYIVMPFMSNGNLHTYLRKYRNELLISEDEDVDLICKTQKRMLDMCLQIAKGMQYLTGHKLVHRDLAARNCMYVTHSLCLYNNLRKLDQNYVIKVADFGLSVNTYAKSYFRREQTDGVKLPIKWMAYESLTDGIFSEKTDVWSFGVTCWEIFSTAKTPYPGIHPPSLIVHLENGERLSNPNNAACSDSMYEVMQSCWDADPQQRPTFSQLVDAITSLLDALADYLDVSTFVTGEQEIEANTKKPQVVENQECNEEASQEGWQTAETHFQGGHVPNVLSEENGSH